MPEFKVYKDGLVTTKVHGMDQDAFVVTEDKMKNFNNRSFEFQIVLSLFSIALGFTLANLSDIRSVAFIVSIIITALLAVALIYNLIKFKGVRKSVFRKQEKE